MGSRKREYDKGRDTRIYDPHIQIDEIYGSNLNFVVSALPHIGKLMMRSLGELISSSDSLVIAQKPTAAALPDLGPALRHPVLVPEPVLGT